jgi:hypothetical protein
VGAGREAGACANTATSTVKIPGASGRPGIDSSKLDAHSMAYADADADASAEGSQA